MLSNILINYSRESLSDSCHSEKNAQIDLFRTISPNIYLHDVIIVEREGGNLLDEHSHDTFKATISMVPVIPTSTPASIMGFLSSLIRVDNLYFFLLSIPLIEVPSRPSTLIRYCRLSVLAKLLFS